MPNKGIEGKLEGLKYDSRATFYYPELSVATTSYLQTNDSAKTESSEGGNCRLPYLHTGPSVSASHPVTMILPVLFLEIFLVLNLTRLTGNKCNKIDSFDKTANCLQ